MEKRTEDRLSPEPTCYSSSAAGRPKPRPPKGGRLSPPWPRSKPGNPPGRPKPLCLASKADCGSPSPPAAAISSSMRRLRALEKLAELLLLLGLEAVEEGVEIRLLVLLYRCGLAGLGQADIHAAAILFRGRPRYVALAFELGEELAQRLGSNIQYGRELLLADFGLELEEGQNPTLPLMGRTKGPRSQCICTVLRRSKPARWKSCSRRSCLSLSISSSV